MMLDGSMIVDIGAYDGVKHSNTYFFEKELGWKGICFEPHSETFSKLCIARDCICINACISSQDGKEHFIKVNGEPIMLSGLLKTYDPRHFERLKHEIVRDGGSYEITEVSSMRLNKILEKYDVKTIDYLSIDTEGNEIEILKSIDFEAIHINVITVENNYNDPEIRQLLESKGFKYITRLAYQDEIYVHSDMQQ